MLDNFSNFSSGIHSVSNNLNPDQYLCFVGPDLGPNCSQGLSALAGKDLNRFKRKFKFYLQASLKHRYLRYILFLIQDKPQRKLKHWHQRIRSFCLHVLIPGIIRSVNIYTCNPLHAW